MHLEAITARRPGSHISFLLSLFAFFLDSTVQPAFARSNSTSVAPVTTGLELVSALANPGISLAVLSGSGVTLQDNDWSQCVTRNTDFSISGDSVGSPTRALDPSSWPVLDLNYLMFKIRLGANVTLNLRNIVLQNYQAFAVDMVPGLDILAPSMPGADASVVFQNAIFISRVCLPPGSTQILSLQSLENGTNNRTTQDKQQVPNVSQPGCINTTSNIVPPVSRCWPDLGVYEDATVAGFDIDTFGQRTATNYLLHLQAVTYLCQQQMRGDCVSQLGLAGCHLSMFPWQPPPSPPACLESPPAPPAAELAAEQQPGTHRMLIIIVSSVFGGVGTIAVISLVATMIFIMWDRQAELCEHATNNNGVQDDGEEDRIVQRLAVCLGDANLNMPEGNGDRNGTDNGNIPNPLQWDVSIHSENSGFSTLLHPDPQLQRQPHPRSHGWRPTLPATSAGAYTTSEGEGIGANRGEEVGTAPQAYSRIEGFPGFLFVTPFSELPISSQVLVPGAAPGDAAAARSLLVIRPN